MIYFRLISLCLLAATIVSCTSGRRAASAGVKTPERPNIIFVLADDLGYGDLSSYGQEHFSTPHIDRLAARGLRFTQHYSGATVCAPSRSALLTGQHTGHTFIRGNYEVQPEGQYPLPDSIFTLAESLKAAGYVTGAFGKWGLGFPGSEGDPVRQGFDRFFGYNCQRLGHNYYPRHLWSDRDSLVLADNTGSQTGTYAPDLIHDQTLAFLEENADTTFFLYVPSIIPHAELIAPDSILASFRGTLLEENSYAGTEPGDERYRTGGYSSQETPRAAFAAMVHILDRQVGEIVRKLEELGIADNTLIVFTSDNGPHQEGGADPDFFDSNGPLRGYKRDLYEGGIRVPMIAVWPNRIAAGGVSDHVSAFWDFFPTFSELAGAPGPVRPDGLSLVPTLLGEGRQAEHDYLYWEVHERNGRQAVRKGKWKAVRYNVNDVGLEGGVELYDLSTDPGETEDLQLQYPEVAEEMKEIMRVARTPSSVFSFAQEAYRGE
ncbi:arylsulfatase [Neolewinella litorea]|uniref:Arylsulfatase n=1 Tax=Neolewinella litorea TaxID=2562452 RepID=A0A4S4NMP3_9BACT|nr:arylsulfatase [Neolewinella litorea]THH39651.1 arylsulfatase [Neolewinella litorea]